MTYSLSKNCWDTLLSLISHPPSSYTKFGELTAINNIGREKRWARRKKQPSVEVFQIFLSDTVARKMAILQVVKTVLIKSFNNMYMYRNASQ